MSWRPEKLNDRSVYRFLSQSLDCAFRNCDEEPIALLRPHICQERYDFDEAVAIVDVQLHAGPNPRLFTHSLRNYQ